jgi:cytochrome c oxidase subunit 3
MDATIASHGHSEEHGMEAGRRLRLGVLLYVLTDVVFVALLFAAYVFLRSYNTQGYFLPKGIHAPSFTQPAILMGILVVSGLSYLAAYNGLKRDNQALYKGGVVLAVVLMIVAMVGQIRFMGQLPFTTADGSFASSYIMLNGYHAFHLIIGSLLGLGLMNRALRGRYSSQNTDGVATIGYFWYWTSMLAVLLWLLWIVIPPA